MNINYILIALSFLVISSVVLNIYLILKLKSARKSRPESVELKEFLADLLVSKSGLIRVNRVDQAQLFLKSPRDMR